jgi:hypothetical protein
MSPERYKVVWPSTYYLLLTRLNRASISYRVN